MKHFLSIILLSLLFFSCYEYNDTYVKVDIVKVEFVAKSVFSVETEGFRSTADELTIPSNFKAYFIAAESKGPYTTGDLIKTLDVSTGVQTIEVPKLKYNVYVTNYDKSGDWYIWNDAIEQLPKASFELYLYGKNTIDYVTQTVGEVKVNNPYSAIFINKEFLDPARTPREFDGGLGEYNTFNSEWFYMFVRKRHNSQVWITQYNGNKSYQWSEDVVANKIYRYRFNNDPGTTDEEGNFTVIVDPWGDEYDETISVL